MNKECRCRQVPVSEMIEISRYLANLFSCDVESLPTELLVHAYWTIMPNQFAGVRAYSRCLQTRVPLFVGRACDPLNPYYCGQRFGDPATVDRFAVCRQLLNGSEAFNYTVPNSVRLKTSRYRACLARSRSAV